MKKLLLGNHAAALALSLAGCKFISSYPGTPSTEITEAAATYPNIYAEWAPNEKSALEAAFGASLAGTRAAVAQKHVGLNVAADPLFSMSYSGINAGLVIFVADDPNLHSSQNEQDSRHYARAAKIPLLEPADSQDILDFTLEAFNISESFDTPVLIRLNTRVAHSQSCVTFDNPSHNEPRHYIKDISKFVLVPAFAKKRHIVVEDRLSLLADAFNHSTLNRVQLGDSSFGFVTASSYHYIKEILPYVSVLKLGSVFPLPLNLIRDFAAKVNRLIVLEELDPFIQSQLMAAGIPCEGASLFPRCGEFSPNLIAEKLGLELPSNFSLNHPIPPRPPVLCPGCPHRGLFFALKKNNCTVLGDIGCYTLAAMPPLSSIDMTLCMGASIGATHGFNKVLGEKSESNTVAVLGDSTFVHSGMTGLANVAYNQSNSTVIILDNSITGMTGHQQNPTTGLNIKGEPAGKINLEALCRAMGINRVRVVDPYNLKECDVVIKEELAAKEPSVIISRRPCALLKNVKHKPPLRVDKDKCIGCKSCMKIGCPAISMKNGKAVVDQTQCVGCEVCSQLCPKKAFGRET